MKLAANLSLMFTELPLLQRFKAARDAGFEAVEIQFPYEASINDLVMARSDADVAVVLINVAAGDLMSGGDGLACVPQRKGDYRCALAQCSDYAEALDVSRVNVLSGRCHDKADEERRWMTFLDNLQHTDEHLAGLGVTTTFEAINTKDMPGFLIHRADHLWRVMAQVSSPNIKAQYDLYHMAMMGEDLCSDLQRHLGKIGHIQFADCPGRGEPGTGDLDVVALLQEIDRGGYDGYVAAEYRPTVETNASLGWLRDLLMRGLYGAQ